MTFLDFLGYKFLREKSKIFEQFESLCLKITNGNECNISLECTGTDYEREFENENFVNFCNS